MAKKKRLGGSLQDQLKSAGLVTDKQIKKAKKVIHRQEMRVKQGVEVDETKVAVDQALAEKQAKDRARQETLNQLAAEKALAAQIKQLIAMNKQREQGDIEYNFTEANKIKKIYVSQQNKTQLNKGYLAIVRFEDGYQLVPEQVARKIQKRLPDQQSQHVLYLYDREQDVVDDDDPYKDFQIPDDLESVSYTHLTLPTTPYV